MYGNFKYQNSRVVGFAGPFLLGALTGGVATAAFNPYRPNYNYYGYPGYYYPYYY